MTWTPLNLTQTCPSPTQLTACTYFGHFYLNLLVQLYGDSYDSRRKREEAELDQEEYDYIVIGAGTAGCVVANRLSAFQKWRVLLLEIGDEEPEVASVPSFSTALLGSSIDWAFKTQPDGKSCTAFPGGQCAWPRGKVMGGSSTINSMVYIRGNKVDYDGWAEMGNDGWSYDEVLPYFKKSEEMLDVAYVDSEFHGYHGEQPIARFEYLQLPPHKLNEAFEEKGVEYRDINGAHQEGTMQAQAIGNGVQRVSANLAFIRPIRYERNNLVIKTKSEVTKILIDDDNVAYGVEYLKDGKYYTATASKEVILSAGAINSPQLLMLSGIGPKSHLEDIGIEVKKDLAVGENLHDHVTFNGILVSLPNETNTLVSHDEVIDRVREYKELRYKHGPLSANGPVNTVAFIKTDPNLPAPNIQYQVNNVVWQEYVREPDYSDALAIFPSAFYTAMVPRTMNITPKSRGYMLLNKTDPYAAPLLYPNYFGDDEDMEVLLAGVKFLLSLEDTDAFRSIGAEYVKIPLPACDKFEWGTDDYLRCLATSYTTTTYHPCGTCKMGPAWDEKAVVDPRLRVYGVSNLRVIDSSIFPVVVRGNTNIPSLMVGERGVAFVIEDQEGKQKEEDYSNKHRSTE